MVMALYIKVGLRWGFFSGEGLNFKNLSPTVTIKITFQSVKGVLIGLLKSMGLLVKYGLALGLISQTAHGTSREHEESTSFWALNLIGRGRNFSRFSIGLLVVYPTAVHKCLAKQSACDN